MQRDLFDRLARIDKLIRIKATGTPAQLAERLGVSERTVYEYLNLMKEYGAPIRFSNYRQSYYYYEDGSFLISFHPYHKAEPDTGKKAEPDML